VAPASDTAPLVARALEAQRARTARVLAQIRVLGVAAVLALGIFRAVVAHEDDWRVLTTILAAYAAGALALLVAVRLSSWGARWAGLGVAFVDVPMVFLAQWVSIPVSPSPGGVAGFTLGIFVLLVLLGALSLDRRQVALVAITAAVAEVLLQRQAGIRGGAWAASVVVIGAPRRPPRTWSAACGRSWPASPPSNKSASAWAATSRPASPSASRASAPAPAPPTPRS
jgi:adenylate cyclase